MYKISINLVGKSYRQKRVGAVRFPWGESRSPDGVTRTQVGANATPSLGNDFYVGVASASHVPGVAGCCHGPGLIMTHELPHTFPKFPKTVTLSELIHRKMPSYKLD